VGALEIIPVIDLLDNHVVHARYGERHHYKPIQSTLSVTSLPLDIVQGLLKLYPFKQLYIADLNAVQKRGNHRTVIASIINAYPALNILLDCGISSTDDLVDWKSLDVEFVIGSENLDSVETYTSIPQDHQHILSLDFGQNSCLGPQQLFNEPGLWPEKVIAMTLSQVGSEAGPAMARLNDLISKSNGKKIYAAGGIRHTADLQALKKIGLSGVLVATALHSGAITSAEISRLS
jgi:phosphoribosylformimino-5-aminoimidazole carboxamide ribotide isomerase